MLDDDAGNTILAGIRNHAIIVPQSPVRIFSIYVRILDFNTTVIQTQCRELIQNILAQLLAGLVNFLFVAAVIGIKNLGPIRRVSITTVRVNVNTHENFSALIYCSLHAKPQATIIIISIFILRARKNNCHACVILKFRFASLGYFPIDVRLLKPVRSRPRIHSAMPRVKCDDEPT